ncbi:MAG: DUF1330 domain-containing protein [Desulfobacterales bacterium]|nr:DUF1330 domain-containing protein [Desulfobacterales bacterium]
MSCYFVALIDIHDPQRYEQYLAGYDDVFNKFRGQVIAVEDNPAVLEGTWPAGRTVIIKFPNEHELQRWYESEAYQVLAKHRKEASVSSIAIIPGRDS